MRVTTLEWKSSDNNKTLLKLIEGGLTAEVPPYNLDYKELGELIEALRECLALVEGRKAVGIGGAN